MNKRIITVCGPIVPESLGLTSMHEHVLCDLRILRKRMEPFLPAALPLDKGATISLDNLGILRHAFILAEEVLHMSDVDVMLQEVMSFKESGGAALAEMSVPGIRGNIADLKRISERSNVSIVASTGLYSFDTWPDRFKQMDVREMSAFMLDEATQGIEESGIKPGNIKVALDSDGHPPEMNAVRAGARVSLETGLPLTIHQGMYLAASQGAAITRILREEGADLSRTILAHCSKYFCITELDRAITEPGSWKLNTDTARELLDTGLNISIDLFGHSWDAESINYINPTDWQQMAGLVELIKRGYVRQIVLGTDCFMKLQMRSCGGEGYGRLTNYVIPTLRKVGISEEDIRTMTIDNPARLLSVQG